MLKVTGYVMYVAPLAIFAAISSVIATQGWAFAELCLVYWRLLCGDPSDLSGIAGGRLHGAEKEIFRLVAMLKDPVLVAFTTSSSEAAYPKTLEQLARFGCSRNIASFVLPIGYSFNLVGSMVYCSFASMFIAQAYNIHLSFTEVTVLMLTLMLASKALRVYRARRWWCWRQPFRALTFRWPGSCC